MKTATGNIVEQVTQGIILQQVNCQGIMGSGVAAAIRSKWAGVFENYSRFCRGKRPIELLGDAHVVTVSPGLVVANLFGQLNFGRTGERFTSYDALDAALLKLGPLIDEIGCTSTDVHHPLIGCGLGGGHWEIVAEIIKHRIGHDTTLWTL